MVLDSTRGRCRRTLRGWWGSADRRAARARHPKGRTRGRRRWVPLALLAGLCLVLATAAAIGSEAGIQEGRDSVVLLHGLGRTRTSMLVLAQRLERAGYNVTNVGYDSLGGSLAEHVQTLAAEVSRCVRLPRIHFARALAGGRHPPVLAEPPDALDGLRLVLQPGQRDGAGFASSRSAPPRPAGRLSAPTPATSRQTSLLRSTRSESSRATAASTRSGRH